MQEYIVSLDIVTSATVTESDLTTLFDAPPSDFGERNNEDAVWWSYESSLEQTRDLAEHIDSIASEIHPSYPIQLTEDIKMICLNIGLKHDQFIVNISLPPRCLDVLKSKVSEFEIKIACYPTTFDQYYE